MRPKRNAMRDWSSPLVTALLRESGSLAAAVGLALTLDLRPQPRSGRQEMLEDLVNRF